MKVYVGRRTCTDLVSSWTNALQLILLMNMVMKLERRINMNNVVFNAIVANRCAEINNILGRKAEEYARGDRLSNFKKAARLFNCTPEKALRGFVGKHIIALIDYIDDIDKGVVQTQDMWDEKIGDIINYMILLEALVTERIDNLIEESDDRPQNRKS